MAANFLPIIIGGAALFILSGKKKSRSSKSGSSKCVRLKSQEAFNQYIKSANKGMLHALVFFPDGESEKGEMLCEQLRALGATAAVSRAAYMATFTISAAEELYMDRIAEGVSPDDLIGLVPDYEDAVRGLAGVLVDRRGGTGKYTKWGDIHWNNPGTLLG